MKNTYNSILISLTLLICTFTATAQVQIEWDKTIGGSSGEGPTNTIPTDDGGYLITGSSGSPVSGDKTTAIQGFWIVKVDSQGNVLWDKSFGSSGSDGLNEAIVTSDGGYLLAGTSDGPASGDKSENSKGGFDYWVVKLDKQGNKLWDKTLGGSNEDELRHVTEAPDGKGYLLGGHSPSSASGDKSEDSKGIWDYWVVKVDTQGNKIWDKTFGGNDEEYLWSTISTSDGGYLLGGQSYSNASGDKSENSKGGSDYWIVKINAQGDKVWDKTIGGEGGENLLDIVYTQDENYLLTGHSSSDISGDKSENSQGGGDYWIVQINTMGDVLWDKTIGGSGLEELPRAILTPDGGYVLGGYSTSPSSGDKSEDSRGGRDYWVVKVDTQGNKVWDKTIGGSDDDYLFDVINTPDGHYLLTGSSRSNASGDKTEDSNGSFDIWIVKLVNEVSPVASISSLTLINAETDQDIQELQEGEMINLAYIDCSLLNIRANASPEQVDSVHFILNGPFSYQRMERKAPYALFGDIQQDYMGRKLPPGIYSITVTPFDKGQAGTALSLTFEIVEDTSIPHSTIVWDKTFGGNINDFLSSAIPAPDGGYLFGGTSPSAASGDKSEENIGGFDFWILKTDVLGNKQWDKTFGGSESDDLHQAIATSDGGYLLAGTSGSNTSGDKSEDNKGIIDYWVIKTDRNGNKIWDKTFGGNHADFLSTVVNTPDKGYLLAGYSNSNVSGDKSEDNQGAEDFWIVKIDEQGNKLWDKTYGAGGMDILNYVIVTPDGGYMLAGSSNPETFDEAGEGKWEYWIIKIDKFGHKQWDKTFGGNANDFLSNVILATDMGYLLAGYSNSDTSGDKSEDSKGSNDFWLIKIDKEGNKIWDKTIGGNASDNLRDAILTPDEGYLLAGVSQSNTSGDKGEDGIGGADYWVIKIDALGNKIWDKTIGGSAFDNLKRVIPAVDGGYLVAGDSWSNISGDKSENSNGTLDFWIVKLKDQPTPKSSIISLTLVNAQTDEDIQELQEGDVVNLSELNCSLPNIRANTSPEPVDSVHFILNGPFSYQRMERKAPYALFGDIQGDYMGRKLPPGDYTITATSYLQGQAGILYSIYFSVNNSSYPAESELLVKVYPNPSPGLINIVHQGVTESAELRLLDYRGKLLLRKPLSPFAVHQWDLSTNKKGIYYLKVVSLEKVQTFRIILE